MTTLNQFNTLDAAGNILAYNVLPYSDSLDSQIPQGMRMCYLSWKGNEDTGKKALSVPRCVFVPILPFDISPVELKNAVRDAIQAIQDKQIRSLVEEDLKANKLIQPIPVTSCSASAISAKYAETSVSTTRLSKESIAAWFDASIADKLAITFATKSGMDPANMTEANMLPMVQAAEQRKSIMEKLAAPGFTVQVSTALQLLKVLELADDQSNKVLTSLRTKLDKMSVVEPLDSFGL